jgi:nucleotide-binding universal stress UspA family protein
MTDIADSQQPAAAGAPPTANLHLVTGYDGSPPAARALSRAVALLQGRQGSIDVVYVAHVPSVDMMSADALVEVEADFSEVEKELRASAAAELDGRVTWEFQSRRGPIAGELIEAASAIGDAHPSDTVAIVVGSSSSGSHRIVGSVAVALARHCPVPLVIVP